MAENENTEEKDLEERWSPANNATQGHAVGSDSDDNAPAANGVADNTATGTANASATATGNTILPADAKTGMEEIAQNPTNEYGEGVYFNGKMDKGTLNPEGAGLNERMAMASHPYHELTPEEREKEQKKEKRDKFWASLGDTVSSLSNLYFTTQYAPNADLATKQTDAVNARYDKLKADRDKDREAWWNARLAGRKQDQDEAEKGRGWRYKYRQAQQAKEEKARDRANNLQISLAQLADKAAQREWQGKQNEAKNQSAETVAKLNKEGRIGAAYAGKEKEYYAYDEKGNVQRFTSAEAADRFARDHGTYAQQPKETTTESNTTSTDDRGKKSTKKTSQTKTEQKSYSENPNKGKKNVNGF